MDTYEENNNTVDLGNATENVAPEKSSAGPIVGAVIIVLVLVLGGVYLWGKQVNQDKDALQQQSEQANAEASIDALSVQSTSDSVSSIKADVSATDLNSLDAELSDIEQSLSI